MAILSITPGVGLGASAGAFTTLTLTDLLTATAITASGLITANDNIALTNTTFASPKGVITKGGFTFAHDFNYGFNGAVTTAGSNLFIGTGAGNLTMGAMATIAGQASYNTGVGVNALKSNTLGSNNSAFGVAASQLNTIGAYNCAFGVGASQLNTVGGSNSSFGYNALTNSTASYNSAFGANALQLNTSGSSNCSFGPYSSQYNQTGNFISAFGTNALILNTASGSSGFGNNALSTLTTGPNNSAFGNNSGQGITTGSGNTIIGANVTGLAAALTNNIILANSTGAIKAQHDGTNWAFTGGIAANAASTITTSGASGTLILTDTGAGGATLRLNGSGATTPNKYIRANNGNLEIINSAYSAAILTLSDSGIITLSQQLDISNAAAGQIKFPVTQNASANAKTLDDYEEGTWTPSITFGGASVGVTYAGRYGNYTKIGRSVFVSGRVTLSAKGSSTGAIKVAGLPFTNVPSGEAPAGCFVVSSGSGLSALSASFVESSATTIAIYSQGATGFTAAVETNATNTFDMIFSATYHTAT